MVDTAGQLSTIEEFLRFDDGTDRRYQLIRGAVVMMTPPLEAHGTIVANLVGAIGRQLQPQCRVVIEAGIVLPDRNDTYYQADLAVTCTPHQRGRRWVDQPRLIVEVLSPSTEHDDRGLKLDDYATLASVQELVLVASEKRRVQHWRRSGDDWLVRNMIGDADLRLKLVKAPIPLAAIYQGLDL